MKKISSFFLALLILVSLAVPVYANNSVNSIDVEAVIEDNGSMQVTQTWKGEFNEGTENYIPMNAPAFLKITNLKVSDENGEYEFLDDWDVDASFSEKANKCGVNYIDNGYEICFGISEYGQKEYVIEYTLKNVVGGYSDYDGTNFRFANDKMNTTPTDVTVDIRLANGKRITDDIADIWAFGYDGQVAFSNDGHIVAYTESPIYSNNHVTIMFALDKNIIKPSRLENGSFEKVKEKAFDGSDYDNEDKNALIFFILITVFIIAIIAFIAIKTIIDKKRMKEFTKQSGYFRDVPNGGRVNVTYALGKQFNLCEESAIVGNGMLRLIEKGHLSPIIDEKIGFMGNSKEEISLQLVSAPDSNNPFDSYLFTLVAGAAGADGILQSKELKRYVATNDKLLRGYIDNCFNDGKAYLQSINYSNGKIAVSLKKLSDSGRKELAELVGFRQYLIDFSLIAERGIKEVPIWKELLSYAMLFGIADTIMQQMKQLYPEISVEIDMYYRNVYMAHFYSSMLYSSMRSAEQKRSSGSGGSASFGGGGGSFGGGSGGGSR